MVDVVVRFAIKLTLYLVFHRWRIPHGVLAFAVCIDEVCHEFRMSVQNLFRPVQTQHHEGCGIGVGGGAVVGDDGRRQMLCCTG